MQNHMAIKFFRNSKILLFFGKKFEINKNYVVDFLFFFGLRQKKTGFRKKLLKKPPHGIKFIAPWRVHDLNLNPP